MVAGGGFAGLYAVRALERKLPPHSAKITVVSESNFLLYSPLLPAMAGGALNPRHVTVPIREEAETLDWTVELFFRRDSAEWIPPRLPRLSLAVVRDPEAVEVSMKAAADGDEQR